MMGRLGGSALAAGLATALSAAVVAVGADHSAISRPDPAASGEYYREVEPGEPRTDTRGRVVGPEDAELSNVDSAKECPASPRLSGTFIQPYLAAGWSVSDWVDEFQALKQACIAEVVLQWTADSGKQTAVYPTRLTGYTQTGQEDLVENALTAADSVGVQIYLGLQVNDEWWNTYTGDAAWLAGEAAVATFLLDELAHRYGGHDSLAGWYVPFEVDNWHHPARSNWETLSSFYSSVSQRARALTPGSPVVVAPFFNPAGGLAPAQWTEMWVTILSGGHIDVIALQDGVGAGHATADQLATWFAATRAAIDQAGAGTELWADTETFTIDLQPMAVRDVVAHMAAVEGYVSRFWSFSYNHYQSPRQVGPHYHQAYLGYLATGTVD
jgi:hypothetical protein